MVRITIAVFSGQQKMGKKVSGYESEHTRFMREWLQKHPEQLEVQKTGRAMWWDRPQPLRALMQGALNAVRGKTPQG